MNSPLDILKGPHYFTTLLVHRDPEIMAYFLVIIKSWKSQPALGPQNHEKWRFSTPNIWVIPLKIEGCGFPWWAVMKKNPWGFTNWFQASNGPLTSLGNLPRRQCDDVVVRMCFFFDRRSNRFTWKMGNGPHIHHTFESPNTSVYQQYRWTVTKNPDYLLLDYTRTTQWYRDYFISHYKNPYEPISISWNVTRALITAEFVISIFFDVYPDYVRRKSSPMLKNIVFFSWVAQPLTA